MPSTPALPPPVCPKCGSARTARIKREGLVQSLILDRFGLYPWECGGCRKVFNVKNRGKLMRRLRSTGEVHHPPVA